MAFTNEEIGLIVAISSGSISSELLMRKDELYQNADQTKLLFSTSTFFIEYKKIKKTLEGFADYLNGNIQYEPVDDLSVILIPPFRPSVFIETDGSTRPLITILLPDLANPNTIFSDDEGIVNQAILPMVQQTGWYLGMQPLNVLPQYNTDEKLLSLYFNGDTIDFEIAPMDNNRKVKFKFARNNASLVGLTPTGSPLQQFPETDGYGDPFSKVNVKFIWRHSLQTWQLMEIKNYNI